MGPVRERQRDAYKSTFFTDGLSVVLACHVKPISKIYLPNGAKYRCHLARRASTGSVRLPQLLVVTAPLQPS